MFHQNKTDSKQIWQFMKKKKKKMENKKQNHLLPQEIETDKTIIKYPQDIAKESNNFFTSAEPKTLKKHFKTF